MKKNRESQSKEKTMVLFFSWNRKLKNYETEHNGEERQKSGKEKHKNEKA